MIATLHHVTSSSGLRKFLLNRGVPVLKLLCYKGLKSSIFLQGILEKAYSLFESKTNLIHCHSSRVCKYQVKIKICVRCL